MKGLSVFGHSEKVGSVKRKSFILANGTPVAMGGGCTTDPSLELIETAA